QRPDLLTFEIEVGRFGFVDEDLERHAQFAAVVEHTRMPVRDAPGPAVDVLALVEGAALCFAPFAHFRVRGTAPDGPVHAADAVARLENGDGIAELLQFVSGCEP